MPSERSWVSDSLSIRQSLHQHQQGSMSTPVAQAEMTVFFIDTLWRKHSSSTVMQASQDMRTF